MYGKSSVSGVMLAREPAQEYVKEDCNLVLTELTESRE